MPTNIKEIIFIQSTKYSSFIRANEILQKKLQENNGTFNFKYSKNMEYKDRSE